MKTEISLFLRRTFWYFLRGPRGYLRVKRKPRSISDDCYGPKTDRKDKGLRYDP